MEGADVGEGGIFQHPLDRDALSRFCSLLKDRADKVLSGEASFSLTTEVLSRLCHECRRHSLKQNEEDSVPDESSALQPHSRSFELWKKKENNEQEWRENIQFIKDFILSTPSVKITHSYGTISYPINLCRFGNLSSLELRKVPIHLVEGLQALRGHLKSLIANRCFSKPKELLESCGGDRSAPLSWQNLKFISLVFNEIHELDDSLRLLPYVETVDLSHNQIETCDNNLEYLSDVLSINLAYNILKHVPGFSINTRTCLISLTLRGNYLDNIQGLEEATALQNLDLGENFMVKHSVLLPLKALPCLKQLYLDGNPLFYHKQHRTNTVSNLPYRVVTVQFLLDGKRLSKSEIASYRPPKPEQRAFGSSHLSQLENSASINADPLSLSSSGMDSGSISSSTPRKKSRRKKLKARDTEIRDASLDYSSGYDYTPAASPSLKFLDEQMDARRQEALQTKREIELLKEQYGSDYLQAIEDRKLFSQAPSETASDSDGAGLSSKLKKHKRNLSGFKKTSFETSVEVMSSDVSESTQKTSEDIMTETDAPDSASKGKSDGELETGQNLHVVADDTTNEVNNPEPHNEKSDPAPIEERCDATAMPSNPIMAAIERIASGQSSDESGAERNAKAGTTDFAALSGDFGQVVSRDVPAGDTQSLNDVKKGPLVKQDSVVDKDEVFSPIPENPVTPEKKSLKDDVNGNGVLPLTSKVSPKIMSTLSRSLSMQEDAPYEDCRSPLNTESATDTSQASSTILSPNRSTSEFDTSTDNSLQLSENEQESEPVFVTLPEEKDKMAIVTFTDMFLVEKDVRGKVIEKLDMRSLISIDIKKLRRKSSSDEIGEAVGWTPHSTSNGLDKDTKTKEMAIRLKFDYIRKDRQKRCYLADVHDGKKLLSHLQPVLDLKAEREKAKDSVMMQCLKCNKTFNKKDVTQKSQQLPRSGSSKDFHTMKAMAENPAFICPACGSSIVIEIEQDSGKSVETSNPSTPVGSYQSSGSFIESGRKPQKPAPLLRNKSFDSQSLQAKLASKLTARKSSVSSIDLEKSHRAGSGSGSVKSLVLAGSSPQVKQEVKSSLPEPRERSNAFKAASAGPPSLSSSSSLSSSQMAPKEQTLLESEELTYVEDHFVPDRMKDLTSSQRLAFMTSSLRGDTSTKGKYSSPYNNQRTPGRMEDSGFESGVCLSGSSNLTPETAKEMQKSQTDSEGTGRVWKTDGVERRDSEIAIRDTTDSRTSSISESHRHLASMEQRVNSLVQEGEYMDHSGKGRNRRSSISIADLKKLISTSVSSNKESTEANPDGEAAPPTLHNSGSGSSIAILPVHDNPDVSSGAAQIGSLESAPVHFVIGDEEKNLDQPALQQSSSDLIRVSSPLNSNICSSMVSSVYETSVEKESAGTSEVEPVALGSSDSAKSNASVEELTSIYDQPANLHSRSVKSKKKRKRHKKSSPQDVQTSEIDPSTKERQSSTTAYSDLIDKISSPVGSFRKQKVSSSSTEESEGGAPAVARSVGTNDDPDNESRGSEFGEGALEEETTYRFDHLNHRLTLYLMMSLFSEDEEFVCKLQAEIVQYIVPEPYVGILIMTSQRFYILKFTSEDHSKEPEEWLSCVEVQPIPELRYIDVGLGGQSLRIEFVTDCSSYTFVTKDKEKTMQFVEILHNNLAHYAVSQGISSSVVVNEDVDQATLDNLDMDVVSKGKSEQKLLLYCMGFIERGNQTLFPICFVVSTNAICLVRTNHQWPQPRLQGPITVESVGKQFTVLERQKINNVASVEICEVSLRKIKLELFNETEGISTEWNITMTNRQNAVNLIHAISEPWAKEFGVDMEITYSELDF